MDGVVAAPDVFRVLFENDRVRVVGVRIEAGQRVPEHTHRRPSVVVVDQPAMLRHHTDDSSDMATDDVGSGSAKAGDTAAGEVETDDMTGDNSPDKAAAGVFWSDPVGPHVVENIDDHDFHAVRIEVKDAAGTGDPPRHEYRRGSPSPA